MDPNTALGVLVHYFAAGNRARDFGEAREAFDGLNKWLTRGGFLPTVWDVNRAENAALARALGHEND